MIMFKTTLLKALDSAEAVTIGDIEVEYFHGHKTCVRIQLADESSLFLADEEIEVDAGGFAKIYGGHTIRFIVQRPLAKGDLE